MKMICSPFHDGYYEDRPNYDGAMARRYSGDRRFWFAWTSVFVGNSQDIARGVIDDFGTIVETYHVEAT